MCTEYESFGKFLTAKRMDKDITLREMARMMGVSAAFLSDVEKNKYHALTAERLKDVACILKLNTVDKNKMYDLAGKQRNSLPPDLPEYIMKRSYVAYALRVARDLNAGKEDWQMFEEKIKKQKGHF